MMIERDIRSKEIQQLIKKKNVWLSLNTFQWLIVKK